MKVFLVRKFILNLWKQLGGCLACEYEKETKEKIEKSKHRCPAAQDERIGAKLK